MGVGETFDICRDWPRFPNAVGGLRFDGVRSLSPSTTGALMRIWYLPRSGGFFVGFRGELGKTTLSPPGSGGARGTFDIYRFLSCFPYAFLGSYIRRRLIPVENGGRAGVGETFDIYRDWACSPKAVGILMLDGVMSLPHSPNGR